MKPGEGVIIDLRSCVLARLLGILGTRSMTLVRGCVTLTLPVGDAVLGGEARELFLAVRSSLHT